MGKSVGQRKVRSTKALVEALSNQYSEIEPLGRRLLVCLSEQISELIEERDVALGHTIEKRLKTRLSILEKVQRKSLELGSICELDDLAGIRIILLYKDDLTTVGEIIRSSFDLISFEDTATRLDDSQFGYQSDHYVIRIKPEWEAIPTYRGLGELKAEIQVRTMAQHIWAAASHKLQYKNEENVPHPLRRAISRVSALLETVDLELSRVERERQIYMAGIVDPSQVFDLNVDVIAQVLSETWPSVNISPDYEDYNGLANELRHFGIKNSDELRSLIGRWRDEVVLEDKRLARETESETDTPESFLERARRGAYFTQVAMTRIVLRKKFGEEAVNAIVNCSGGMKRGDHKHS